MSKWPFCRCLEFIPRSLFEDPDHRIREQAFHIVRHVADGVDGVDLLFSEMGGSEILLDYLAKAIESDDDEDVVLQVCVSTSPVYCIVDSDHLSLCSSSRIWQTAQLTNGVFSRTREFSSVFGTASSMPKSRYGDRQSLVSSSSCVRILAVTANCMKRRSTPRCDTCASTPRTSVQAQLPSAWAEVARWVQRMTWRCRTRRDKRCTGSNTTRTWTCDSSDSYYLLSGYVALHVVCVVCAVVILDILAIVVALHWHDWGSNAVVRLRWRACALWGKWCDFGA